MPFCFRIPSITHGSINDYGCRNFHVSVVYNFTGKEKPELRKDAFGFLDAHQVPIIGAIR